ncbi:unnamed protein product [Adineta ricciae]|uniref:Uncharacterized protein n=1 Tax=Adineta ricciae TaxID=249248 RepID=A0A815RBZ0_ADIRI|nr:unnamed protein product [Adineta ricciae]CAF1580311.1 unnamed protein product [Adineta ricciae]
MSRHIRNLNNPPEYYNSLTAKQQRNWRRNTREIGRNERLREQYPSMPIPPTATIIHIHYLPPIKTLDDLIEKAKNTKIFTIDTESETINRVNKGALVQIQFLQPSQASTIMLIEMFHRPDCNNLTTQEKNKELCEIILNCDKDIITWDPLEDEFDDFKSYGLFNPVTGITINRVTRILRRKVVIENSSQVPCTRRQEEQYLATANINVITPHILIQTLLGHYKTQTPYYDQRIEKEKRRIMTDYAVKDCIAVTNLYFIMNPSTTFNTNRYETPVTDEHRMYVDDIVDIRENSQPQTPEPQQDPPRPEETEEERKQREKENQKRENEKFKEKKRNRSDFKHEIVRPIYYRYDYRKIRAQLQADQVHYSHQIRINDEHAEVTINFKSEELREDGRRKAPISYFMDVQYYRG